MTIFESSMSAKHFGKQLELGILQSLGRVLVVVLSVYFVLRVQDLYHRGALKYLLDNSYETNLFLLEVVLGLMLPIAMLLNPRIRQSANGLYFAAVLTVLGFVTNRLNVSITGMETAAGLRYVPKWTEMAVTASIVVLGFIIFGLAAKYLPIFANGAEARPVTASTTAAVREPAPVARA
jgi:Ni/Fe-hydrogenase subunit HybB-like protein